MLYASTVATPDGGFTVIADPEMVRAAGWADNAEQLWVRLGVSPVPEAVRIVRDRTPGDATVLSQAINAVRAYYGGDQTAVNNVMVQPAASAFTRQVHEALRATIPGERVSYSDLARRAGHPEAVRAAGSACGKNATALFIPCHRAIRSDGTLGGFLYGLEIKASLLAREGSLPVGSDAEATAGYGCSPDQGFRGVLSTMGRTNGRFQARSAHGGSPHR